jgi:hypothetical protein
MRWKHQLAARCVLPQRSTVVRVILSAPPISLVDVCSIAGSDSADIELARHFATVPMPKRISKLCQAALDVGRTLSLLCMTLFR